MLKRGLVLSQRHLLEHLAACNCIVDNVLGTFHIIVYLYIIYYMYSMIRRIKVYNTRVDSVIFVATVIRVTVQCHSS